MVNDRGFRTRAMRSWECLLILLSFACQAQLQVIEIEPSFGRDPNGRSKKAGFERKENLLLLGKTIKNLTVPSGTHCAFECVSSENCNSYNLAKKPSNGRFECQLMADDIYSKDGNLTESEDFNHFFIKNKCQTPGLCKNGTCYPVYETDDFRCECKLNFSGRHCEIELDACGKASQPCNQGTCVSLDDTRFHCICDYGSFGRFCNITIKDCALFPCKNGGQCVNKDDGYLCLCPPGNTGDECQESTRGFEYISHKETTHRGVPLWVVQAKVGVSGHSRSSSWCQDYYDLCRQIDKLPVGCGRSFRADPRFHSCREKYTAVMLSGDPIDCQSTDDVAMVAQKAGFPSSTIENSFVLGSCHDQCPTMLSTYCDNNLMCLRSGQSEVYTICARPDSNFDVTNLTSFKSRNVTFRLVELKLVDKNSFHENWCREYQRMCEAIGLRPIGKPVTGETFFSCLDYNAVLESSLTITSLSSKLGFSNAPAFMFEKCRSVDCNNTLNIPALVTLDYSYGKRVLTACSTGESESSFRVLDIRQVSHHGKNFKVLQVKVPSSTVQGWCTEYTSLCQSYSLMPVACSMDYQRFSEYSSCRDKFGAVMFRDAELYGCPPNKLISVLAQMANFSSANEQNSFGFHKCNLCADTALLNDSGLSFLNNSIPHELAYTACVEPETAFDVVSVVETTYERTPVLALHTKIARAKSKSENWCRDYEKLCLSYGRKPARCEMHTKDVQLKCGTDYGAVSYHEARDCEILTDISRIAGRVGYSANPATNCFIHDECSECSDTLPTACTSTMRCLRYSGTGVADFYTICAGQSSDSGGLKVISQTPVAVNNTKYIAVKAQVPSDGKSKSPTWCDDYKEMCMSFGLRPLAAGNEGYSDHRKCRSNYNAIVSLEDNSESLQARVIEILHNASFPDAETQNTFVFSNCSEKCPRFLHDTKCHSALHCLRQTDTYVYTVCRDSDSAFFVHQAEEVIYKDYKFLAIKAELPTDKTSKHENWCRDYQMLCRSYGKFPMGVNYKDTSKYYEYSSCRKYGSVHLTERFITDSTSSIASFIQNVFSSAGIAFDQAKDSTSIFHSCHNPDSCPNVISSTAPGLYLSIRHNMMAYTVCVEPDSNIEVIDFKTMVYQGVSYMGVAAKMPERPVWRNGSLCRDYQKLCYSLGRHPIVCKSDGGTLVQEISDGSPTPVVIHNQDFCADNSQFVYSVATSGNFLIDPTLDNSVLFEHCGESQEVSSASDFEIYSKLKGKVFFTLCGSPEGTFDVVTLRRGEINGHQLNFLRVQIPENRTSKILNWCSDYQRLCESFALSPIQCVQPSTPYNCSSYGPANLPSTALMCPAYPLLSSQAIRYELPGKNTTFFTLKNCSQSQCAAPVLHNASCNDALDCAQTDHPNNELYSACVARDSGFEVLEQRQYGLDDLYYDVIKVRVPDVSKYSSWCKDYQRLCARYGKRPVGCGSEWKRTHAHLSCQEEYNAVMEAHNELGCPPNNSKIAEIAQRAGFSSATANNVFALANCSACNGFSKLNEDEQTNAFSWFPRLASSEREAYTICADSDSNLKVIVSKRVVFKQIDYLAVKVQFHGMLRSKYDSWCRDYQRMCESFGRRPVAKPGSFVANIDATFRKCRDVYNAVMGYSLGAVSSNVDVSDIMKKAGIHTDNDDDAFHLLKCSSCEKLLNATGSCQQSLHCLALGNHIGYTVCANSDSNFKVLHTKPFVENSTEFLVVMATLPRDGLSQFGTWCEDYQRMCESYGHRPLACGSQYRRYTQHFRCQDVFNALMLHDDESECAQNVRVARIARQVGFTGANEYNSFAFNSCDVNDCRQHIGGANSRAFYTAGMNPTDRVVYTVCGNSDSKFHVILSKFTAKYAVNHAMHLKLRLPEDGISKYDTWCRDYQYLCESYGMRAMACAERYYHNLEHGMCREKYNAVPVNSCPGNIWADQIINRDARIGSSQANTFALQSCLDEACTKKLANNSCDRGLHCAHLGLKYRIAHTMCVRQVTSFTVLTHKIVKHLHRSFLVIKAMFKSVKSSDQSWCHDYKNLCATYGKRPLACPRDRSQKFHRCHELHNAVSASSSECPLNAFIAELAVEAGFKGATPSNSFGFHKCDASDCTNYLRKDGCESGLHCLSRNTHNRVVYTACATSITSFDVIHSKVYSAYHVIKARVPTHGRPVVNWCKDYQVLCESFGARPVGCATLHVNEPKFGKCASIYRSSVEADYFSCGSVSKAVQITRSAGFSDANAENTFVFHMCDDSDCKQNLAQSGCHSSLGCINANTTDNIVYTLCRKTITEYNFEETQVKKADYQGVPYLVVRARLPSNRHSRKSTWCEDYQALCESYGLRPTGCYYAQEATTNCASYKSVPFPVNPLSCDPRIMVTNIANAAGFTDANLNNSFAFYSCAPEFCKRDLPASGCSQSLSCLSKDVPENVFYTVCRPSPSGFDVIESRDVTHNGLSFVSVRLRFPSHMDASSADCSSNYTSMCSAFDAYPVACSESLELNTSSTSDTLYKILLTSVYNCSVPSGLLPMFYSAGFSNVSRENVFILRRFQNGSCDDGKCNESLQCVGHSGQYLEAYTVCVKRQQQHGFTIHKISSAEHGGEEFTILKGIFSKGYPFLENWCREYQRTCEVLRKRPVNCVSGRDAVQCTRKYNFNMRTGNTGYLSREELVELVKDSGFTDAVTVNVLAFEKCNNSSCNVELKSQPVYLVCVTGQTGFEVKETRTVVDGGLSYKVVHARIPSDGQSKSGSWCEDYSKLCDSYGQRPIVKVSRSMSVRAQECSDRFGALVMKTATALSSLVHDAGFLNVSVLSAITFSHCNSSKCSRSFINSECSAPFGCVTQNTSLEDIFTFCTHDLPISNFEVMTTKHTIHKGSPYLVVKARLPFDGLSRQENWCADYQKLCESLKLRPLACNRDFFDSEIEKAVCLSKYHAVMPRDQSLECPANVRVNEVAQSAGFTLASLNTSWALFSCTSSCTRYINDISNTAPYMMSLDVPSRVVYTVCASEETHNFDVRETRVITFMSDGYIEREYLVIRVRVPSHGTSRQEDWCRDYQRMCESYGRRPTGSGVSRSEDVKQSSCMKYYNSYMLPKDENDDWPNYKPISNIATAAGFDLSGAPTNVFGLYNCQNCPKQLGLLSPSWNVAIYRLYNTDGDFYTICV
ncbi:uncharacterized protein LOC116615639 [Nematostella vectensis]|uniref:uncharacterized protein LOC116615639 n=1 Tax=Nematostella vectensis TaxID=45351 RepID=UPI0013905A30|nr:uncharacterized protein LOC116615639 [Nematostella vectensis]